jgi:hypothetical protein
MTFSHFVLILGTFSGSAVINFFKCQNSRDYLFEISKFKEITKEGNFFKFVETEELLVSGQSTIVKKVPNN